MEMQTALIEEKMIALFILDASVHLSHKNFSHKVPSDINDRVLQNIMYLHHTLQHSLIDDVLIFFKLNARKIVP